MTRIGLAVAMAVWSLPVWAQEVDCTDPFTQIDMTFCAEAEWNAADADLNLAYKEAMQVMKQIDANLPDVDQGAAGLLRQAQRDWISFRDNACDAEGYTVHLGSAEPMVIFGCRARLTVQRTDDLMLLATGDGN